MNRLAVRTISVPVGILIGILALVFLTQCASKPGVIVKEDESQILRKRAIEYWDLVINVNFPNAEKAYQYEAPAIRKNVPFVEYFNRFRMVKYFEAEVGEVAIEENRAQVTVSAVSQTFLPRLPKKVKEIENDKWVKVEGIWYHVPRERVLPE